MANLVYIMKLCWGGVEIEMIQSWRDGSASEGRLGQAELSWIRDSQWEKKSGSLELFSTPQARCGVRTYADTQL